MGVVIQPSFRLISPSAHPDEVHVVRLWRLETNHLGSELHKQIGALSKFDGATGQHDPRFGPQAEFLANGPPFLGTI